MKLDYQLNQTVYTVELKKHGELYKLYEDKINRIVITHNKTEYYTTRDGYSDDICISKEWNNKVYFSRQKSPNKNPEIILGKVFTNKRYAQKYLKQRNNVELFTYMKLSNRNNI